MTRVAAVLALASATFAAGCGAHPASSTQAAMHAAASAPAAANPAGDAGAPAPAALQAQIAQLRADLQRVRAQRDDAQAKLRASLERERALRGRLAAANTPPVSSAQPAAAADDSQPQVFSTMTSVKPPHRRP